MNKMFGFLAKNGELVLDGGFELFDNVDEMEYLKSIEGDGTYICSKEQKKLCFRKGNAPLFLGIGDDGCFVSSCLLDMDGCKKFLLLPDYCYGVVTTNRTFVFDKEGKKIKPRFREMPRLDVEEIDESIYSLPVLIDDVYKRFCDGSKLNFKSLGFSKRYLEKITKIIITGEGSSFFVAESMALNMELLCDVECLAIKSTALMGVAGVLDKNVLLIAISQSGESLSTITAVKRVKGYGAKTLGITSSGYSHLTFLCDRVIVQECDLSCSFHANYLVLALFGVFLGRNIGYMKDLHVSLCSKMAEMLQGSIATMFRKNQSFMPYPRDLTQYTKIVFAGFGIDFGIAQQLAKQYRQILHSSAFAVCLDEIDCYDTFDDTKIFAFVSNDADSKVVLPCLKALNDYGLDITVYTTDSFVAQFGFLENVIAVGDSIPLFNPILITSYVQNEIVKIGEINAKELSA